MKNGGSETLGKGDFGCFKNCIKVFAKCSPDWSAFSFRVANDSRLAFYVMEIRLFSVLSRGARNSRGVLLGVCAAERADYCCETLHALIVDTMTQVINGLIPARHTQCAKIANIPDIRNPNPLGAQPGTWGSHGGVMFETLTACQYYYKLVHQSQCKLAVPLSILTDPRDYESPSLTVECATRCSIVLVEARAMCGRRRRQRPGGGAAACVVRGN
ncbi:hypothetical protein TcasGA2_TC032106 [Tribolium castaneum]|uniref:Uncharacterized protein n=1 Tax=Tribolium castaneum TaxID=7070 RepID=A0A139WM88_TRICA|nr:hypothetical protein TcasGA2_TC032106 [Tribolium castaneum]